MQITVNINAPELAQAIHALAAVLSQSGGIVRSTQTAPQPEIQPTAPQQIHVHQPIEQSAPAANQAPTAPVAQQSAPIAQPAVQQPAPVSQPAAAPTAAPTYDFNQLATATMQLQQAGQNILELFAQFGIQSLNQLPKERYGEYVNVLRQRGAKI